MTTSSEAFAAAARYCSASEHCLSEVKHLMDRFELSAEALSDLLQRLVSEGYVNEERYAKAFVNDKFRFAKWGRIKIRHALYQKGIPETICKDAFMLIDEEDYLSQLNDLLKQKMRSVRANSVYERNGKLVRFVAGRGFEPDLAVKCLKRMGIDAEEE